MEAQGQAAEGETAGRETGDALVLIAYDGSPAARQAIIDTARFLGRCRVLVVTVWEEGLEYAIEAAAMPPDVMGSLPPEPDPDLAQEVDQVLEERANSVSAEGTALAASLGLNAKPLAHPDDEGNVPYTLLALVRKHDAAAIVVGSRGRSGLRARLEGSTSKTLLKHAPCPVIVVHDSDPQQT
jgi:nucleotide-binding universal stress UspA family protein